MNNRYCVYDMELREVSGFLDKVFGEGSHQTEMLMNMVVELKALMQNDIVHFIFNKTDGTRRHAYGTRASDVISRYDTSGTGDGRNPQRAFNGTFPYFDIEKREWRCFRVDRIVEIDNNYTI